MSEKIDETLVELSCLKWLEVLGYQVKHGPSIAPDGIQPERLNYADVVLVERLRRAVARLNPNIPSEAQADAIRKIAQIDSPSLISENRRLHNALVAGVDVEFYGLDGVLRGDQVRVIDFDDPAANDWLAVNQFAVVESRANRRPDVVVFVNGLPLAVLELKHPGAQNATLDGAYNQLQTYKAQIPSLFRTNTALIISDGISARIGSLTADRERFMPWRTVDGADVAPKGSPELKTVLHGVFEQRRFLDLLRDFIAFGETERGVEKILAGYHQFHAVRRAVNCTVEATRPDGSRKIGVIWHTQG